MFKRVFKSCITIILILLGLFLIVYGKALFWSAVIALKLGLAVQGGIYSILGWIFIFLSQAKKYKDINHILLKRD